MIVVESLLHWLWSRASPGAVLAFGERDPAYVHGNTLGLSRHDAKPRVTLRVDLWKLLAGLVPARGLPIVYRFVGLGHAKLRNGNERKQREFGIHPRLGFFSAFLIYERMVPINP